MSRKVKDYSEYFLKNKRKTKDVPLNNIGT